MCGYKTRVVFNQGWLITARVWYVKLHYFNQIGPNVYLLIERKCRWESLLKFSVHTESFLEAAFFYYSAYPRLDLDKMDNISGKMSRLSTIGAFFLTAVYILFSFFKLSAFLWSLAAFLWCCAVYFRERLNLTRIRYLDAFGHISDIFWLFGHFWTVWTFLTNFDIFWCAHGQIQIGTFWSFPIKV